MRTELTIALLSSEGRLLKETKQPSRSFVLKFLHLLYILFTETDQSINDISNTARSVTVRGWNNLQLASKGGAHVELATYNNPDQATSTYTNLIGNSIGIQVGSGNAAATPTDYALQTKIAHGQAAGQLVYAGCEVEPPVISAPNATMLIRGYFPNKSGGNVTVWEVGMYAAGIANGGFAFLICRDVLGAAITVAATQLLRVEYTLQVTV